MLVWFGLASINLNAEIQASQASSSVTNINLGSVSWRASVLQSRKKIQKKSLSLLLLEYSVEEENFLFWLPVNCNWLYQHVNVIHVIALLLSCECFFSVFFCRRTRPEYGNLQPNLVFFLSGKRIWSLLLFPKTRLLPKTSHVMFPNELAFYSFPNRKEVLPSHVLLFSIGEQLFLTTELD